MNILKLISILNDKNTIDKMVKHAWYSKKQSNVYLTCKTRFIEFIWLDKDNKETHCTEVTNDRKSFWDDAVYLGLVYKHKRTIWKNLKMISTA